MQGRPSAPGIASADRGRSAGVSEVFGPAERVCPSCATPTVTAQRSCPSCGAPYAARRRKPLGTPRARLLLIATLIVLLGVITAGVVLLRPGIERAKHTQATVARRATAAISAALSLQATIEQRLHLATGAAHDPGAGARRTARLSARSALVLELERGITADARARAQAGTLRGPILFTSCSPYPPGSTPAQAALRARVGAYACLAVNTPIKGARGTVGEVGDPFWARVDFAGARLVWCKINPRPGERAVGSAVSTVALARACDLERPAPVPLP